MDAEVLVVGGGHAGVEAALAAARLGCQVVLVTQHPAALGRMSCNPSIGGIGKGHLVREVDALGGLMGRAADASRIHGRVLNTQKGPAVQATRLQCDRRHYNRTIAEFVAGTAEVRVIAGEVRGLVLRGAAVEGVVLADGTTLGTRSVVLTTGTFLDAVLHFGDRSVPGGRIREAPAIGLTESLRRLGLRTGRLKTGTPPRLLASSIDWSRTEEQPDDPTTVPFSLWPLPEAPLPRRSCHITWTDPRCHAVVRGNLHRAPLFSGRIQGKGPRYCPSFEDKVVRFAHHDRHHVFLEPEGIDSDEVYPNGLSTSLPLEVQEAMIRCIPGLEEARITQAGYAVEYDFVDPREVDASLHCHKVRGLFLAGQVLGTTGYEEAAALGLLAGANAALHAGSRPPLTFSRGEAYLGVMVDDLTRHGVSEPYRMFTSRAEFRLHLREDNAWDRLSPVAARLGLLSGPRVGDLERRRERLARARDLLARRRLRPPDLPPGEPCPPEGLTMLEWLRRPGTAFEDLAARDPSGTLLALRPDEARTLTHQVRYEAYLDRERREVDRFRRFESLPLPRDLDYGTFPSLSLEVRDRLRQHRPATVGEAARLEGVTPAAIQALLARVRPREGEDQGDGGAASRSAGDSSRGSGALPGSSVGMPGGTSSDGSTAGYA
ncbi:MAG TPA: tRNA uridine-5-carboxymethylaminomethyl(34) synthesis enzyme MnmG [Myxococcota bacterium]|nr:tRNA uridine-5-carboxymethylaminomethyl(34) synthesis enzyme MnmG [Myxococcota bacterium]HQK51487.1 tRNA uridine-5-carboxymethylaminomethyl(34) synthesis enzyme MnmG [Myxococcota bacterium]